MCGTGVGFVDAHVFSGAMADCGRLGEIDGVRRATGLHWYEGIAVHVSDVVLPCMDIYDCADKLLPAIVGELQLEDRTS
jgi:hypothetical protein